MNEYVVRDGFVVFVDGEVYSGGDRVVLTDELYRLYKHRLEGSDRADSIEFEVETSSDEKVRGYPKPYVNAIAPSRLLDNTSVRIIIDGSFFTPDTTVSIDGAVVNFITFVSSLRLIVAVDTRSDLGGLDLTIDNGEAVTIEDAITVYSKTNSLFDLRAGGTAFSEAAIEVRDDMSWERTSEGLRFLGRNPFGSWGRFVGDDDAWVWNRGSKRDLSWIFTNTSSFMLGIGSRANNPTSSSQHYQAEITAYFNSATSFSSLLGNSGLPGRSTIFSSPVGVFNGVKKVTFTSNGEPGGKLSVYNLPSSNISDWLDESTQLVELTIPDSFAADEEELMPFVIPRNGNGTLFLGFILI